MCNDRAHSENESKQTSKQIQSEYECMWKLDFKFIDIDASKVNPITSYIYINKTLSNLETHTHTLHTKYTCAYAHSYMNENAPCRCEQILFNHLRGKVMPKQQSTQKLIESSSAKCRTCIRVNLERSVCYVHVRYVCTQRIIAIHKCWCCCYCFNRRC